MFITGRITYDSVPHSTTGDGLDYFRTSEKPARLVKVEAVLEDGTVVASHITNRNGRYHLRVPGNEDVKVRVSAQLMESEDEWDVQIEDPYNSYALYVLEGSLVNSGITNSVRDLHASSTWDGMSYTTRSGAPFAILDTVLEAMDFVRYYDDEIDYPSLRISWSAESTSGAYYTSNNFIVLSGKQDVDTDEYDPSIIIHEWGHYFQHNFSRNDSLGGSHSISQYLDARLAFSEGFATALASLILRDPVYRDTYGDQQLRTYSFSMEEDTHPKGWYSESTIQSLLYNMFDTNTGVNDSLTLNFSLLLDVFRNDLQHTEVFTTIFPFIVALKEYQPDQTFNIDRMVTAEGMVAETMDKFGSTETNSGDSEFTLPVYIELTSDGPTTSFCTTREFGSSNKLGVYRYFYIDITETTSLDITVEKTMIEAERESTPYLTINESGNRLYISSSRAENMVTYSHEFSPGFYVMYFSDRFYGEEPCYDITVSRDVPEPVPEE